MDMEKAFEDFLENPAYDEAEAALFAVVREAFLAGWTAAGGKKPEKNIAVLPYHDSPK